MKRIFISFVIFLLSDITLFARVSAPLHLGRGEGVRATRVLTPLHLGRGEGVRATRVSTPLHLGRGEGVRATRVSTPLHLGRGEGVRATRVSTPLHLGRGEGVRAARVSTPLHLGRGKGVRATRVSAPLHLGRGEGVRATRVSTPLPEGVGVGGEASFTFVSLNCENLFDCEHDSLKQDDAFLPDGMYQWSFGKYWKKVNNIAREILACGEQEDGSFTIPDMVALCEVENDSVIRDLTQRSLLRNAKYEAIVTHSPDERGIDVTFLYSPLTFSLIESNSIRINPLKDMRLTRDILYVKGQTNTGDTLNVFVVHAPSRSGGEYETRANRLLVASKLTENIDSLRRFNPQENIIVAGDFNDYTDSPSIKYIEEHNLTDISKDAQSVTGKAKGTYKYHGEWASLDHIFVNDMLKDNVLNCRIGDYSFLLCKDEEYGGVQPFRNFKGVKWQNGFSDHLPLILQLSF